MEEIECPICGARLEAQCDHLVADIDITFTEIHAGLLLQHLGSLVSPQSISDLLPQLIAAGGSPVFATVEGGPGNSSENCCVFSSDPHDLVRRVLALN